MPKSPEQDLSRRERQIMNVLYRLGRATVTEIADGMPNAPSGTAIRTHLSILEDKGHIRRQRDGRKNVYRPRRSRKTAARAALSSVLETFFDGSVGEALALHLADRHTAVDDDELERLRKLITDAERSKP